MKSKCFSTTGVTYSSFPKGNPKAIFFEIETKYQLVISTWLGYGQQTQQKLSRMLELAINVFEDIFEAPTTPVVAMINHWDTTKDVYMLNQFEAYRIGDFMSETFVDETQEVEKVQIHFQTTAGDINYKNIFNRFVLRDYHLSNEVNSRIFFVHPTKQVYLLYFDSEIIVGSNDLNQLIPYFDKYQPHIETARRKQFLEQFKH